MMERDKQVSILLDQSTELLKKYERNDLVTEIEETQRQLKNRERVILVCGEFKRGKSTLINALLEQPNLCPVDIDIATSTVSLIRYGKQARVTRYYGAVGGEEAEEIPFEKLSVYATGNGQGDTWLLEVELPCDILKEGLILIDTPGVGGLDPRHSFLTSYFLPKADISLFVVDAGEPLSDAEISFIEEKVMGSTRELVVVLNKADNASDIKTVSYDTEAKLKDALGKDIPVVPVSSRLKLEYLRSGDNADYEESNYFALEQEIRKAVVKHSRVMCEYAANISMNALEEALAPLVIQSEEYKEASNADLQNLHELYLARRKEMEAFCGPTAEWRIKLAKEVQQLKIDVGLELQERSIGLTNKTLKEALEEEGLDTSLSGVASKLEAKVTQIAEEIDEMIIEKTVTVCSNLGNDILVDSKRIRDTENGFFYEFDKNIEVGTPSVMKVLVPGIRNAFFAVAVGNSIPIIGWVAGGLILADGIKSSIDSAKSMHVDSLNKALSDDVQKSTLALRKYFDRRIAFAESIMQETVQKEAERLQTRYKEIAESFEAMKNQSTEQRKIHEKLVQTKIRPIEQMIKYLSRTIELNGLSDEKMVHENSSEKLSSSIKISS